MSADKLIDSTQLDSDLTSVANAIRAKSGGSGQLAFPAGFVSEIGAIPTGGGSPSPDEILNGQNASGTDTPGTFPSGVVTITRKNVVWMFGGNGRYAGNSAITKLILPNLVEAPADAARAMSSLTHFIAQKLTTISTCVAADCSKLLYVDILGNSINKSLAFAWNPKLEALILRKTASIVSVSQTNAFNSTKSTSHPLKVYVPSALKSTYEGATNWSTWVNDGTVVFYDLEGSAYESTDWWDI